MTDLQALRSRYRAQKATILESIASPGTTTRGVRATLGKLSGLADSTLKILWRQAGFTSSFALVAVGGFGRGELFPYSDVDVLVLLPDAQSPANDAQLKTRIEGFIGSCWDAGLEIGSSVRTVAECLEEAARDVTVQTSLLEARLITGSAALFAGFNAQFFAAIDAKAFFIAKTLELRQRHSKFEDTPYALEPNCKESPGGLRDLQVILWVAKAAGYGNDWDALAKSGLATAFEIKQIKHNEAVLRLIRARLHLLARRREDRLVFDLQNAMAQSPTIGRLCAPARR
jgi:[protein-PII] uridylyltransferase